MFVLMISRSFETGSLGVKKKGHKANTKENFVNTRGHIFEVIIMNLAQNFCLDDF